MFLFFFFRLDGPKFHHDDDVQLYLLHRVTKSPNHKDASLLNSLQEHWTISIFKEDDKSHFFSIGTKFMNALLPNVNTVWCSSEGSTKNHAPYIVDWLFLFFYSRISCSHLAFAQDPEKLKFYLGLCALLDFLVWCLHPSFRIWETTEQAH